MKIIEVNSFKKAERIIAELRKQKRTAWYEKFYYSNFPRNGFGCQYVIFYK